MIMPPSDLPSLPSVRPSVQMLDLWHPALFGLGDDPFRPPTRLLCCTASSRSWTLRPGRPDTFCTAYH